MRRFCAGDESAFEVLFDRHTRPIHTYLHRLVQSRSAADDLTQVAFMSLVRSRGRFDARQRLKPWLYAIATNAARDFQRRRKPEELTSDGELPVNVAAEPVELRDAGLTRSVHAALQQLPEGQRACIVMHRFEGMSFSEIAAALSITETAAKVRAHRGYERLRELLAELREER